ncbi:MAG: phosphonate ABC transporter ATP-binding protein [Turicibacter sp.]|nr:phosphonate ABC transporter ATP-binding protein [Turicibacter sp.]
MLQLQQVSKTYDNGKTALQDISFKVSKGDFVSIIGPSGAGKSTLLRTINQMIPVSDGQILFHEDDVTRANRKKLRTVRRRMGMIFQHYNLVTRMTAVENVLHGRLGYKSTISGVMGRYTEEEKKKAFELLGQVGLEEFVYTRCDQLSGGQKQRVGIARALMQEPELILCDEPIASLDPKSSKVVMDYLKSIAKDMGITCLVNLHQVDVAMDYSDRIIGVSGGKVLFDGPPSELTPEILSEIYKSEDLLV